MMRNEEDDQESEQLFLQYPDFHEEIKMHVFATFGIRFLMQTFTLSKSHAEMLRAPLFAEKRADATDFTTLYAHGEAPVFSSIPRRDHVIELSDDGRFQLMDSKFTNSYFPVPEYGCLILVGSVKGLLCLRKEISKYQDTLFLLNLMTKERRNIMTSKHGFVCRCNNDVFGYDPVGREYKTVRIKSEFSGDDDKKFEIFTLGRDENWRPLSIPTFPKGTEITDGVSCTGTCFWLLRDVKGEHLVMSFDLTTEVDQYIIGAPFPPQSAKEHLKMFVCNNDGVCVAQKRFKASEDNVIWRLDVGGKKWEPIDLPALVSEVEFEPLCSTKCGNLLLKEKVGMAFEVGGFVVHLFNPKSGVYTKLEGLPMVSVVMQYNPNFARINDIIGKWFRPAQSHADSSTKDRLMLAGCLN